MSEVRYKDKVNPILIRVMLASIAFHIMLGLIAVIITISSKFIPNSPQFDAPPRVTRVHLIKPMKVQIRENLPKQIKEYHTIQPVSEIALTKRNFNLSNTNDIFRVSESLGHIDVGRFSLLGDTRDTIGIGISNLNVFGLKGQSERVLFVFDINRYMVTDWKGGLNSFQIIKDEIIDMVGNLNTGTLYNVILHDRIKTVRFKDELVPAGDELHREFAKWMSPINTNPNYPGLEGVKAIPRSVIRWLDDYPIHDSLMLGFRGNDTAFMTQLALEQGVDSIYFITGYHKGFEAVHRKMNLEEEIEWNKKSRNSRYQRQLKEHNLEVPQMRAKIIAEMARINEYRETEGMPPRVLDSSTNVYFAAKELELKWETPHPGETPFPQYDEKEVFRYFRDLNKAIYAHHYQIPSINVVLFLSKDQKMAKKDESNLRDYVRFYRGKYRIIYGLEEIKNAHL
jgi:hypothetical protein